MSAAVPSIAAVRTLTPREHRAVAALIRRVLDAGDPPLLRAFLFGSKARGDFRRDSDVDVLAICDVDVDERDAAATAFAEHAERVSRATGVSVEPWAVPAADLEVGGRTPMLVDALDDGIPLWPRGAPPIRIAFTPADAAFCAACLVDWVDAGGRIVRRALAEGRHADAAVRSRDDITRMATAALLLDGDTRHRRAGTLRRFDLRWVRTGRASTRVRPALDWAAAAYPPPGTCRDRPVRATRPAIRSAPLGFELASEMEWEVMPILLERIPRPP
ncbi:MAG TPA: nucleotidyltransferase domain-containing protein [Longimicrobiales bacterium]